jgi:archaemetzincin
MRWLALLTLVACGSDRGDRQTEPPPVKPAPVDPRIDAIGETSLMTPALRRAVDPADFAPPPEPQPGEWLYEHPEPPQTFDDYLGSKFHPVGEHRRVLYILPLGTFPPEAPSLDSLAKLAGAYFQLEVRFMPALKLADVEAKRRVNDSTGKRQLLAPEVLAWMARRVPDDAYAVMALTMEDLYPEESWNFVFGMASFHERVGVQSLARQDPAFFGQARASGWKKLALRRAAWTVVHEIAHMFGLSHCVHYVCVVAGSNSQDESDGRPLHACPVCLHKLWWAIRFDPVAREHALVEVLRELGIDDEAAWSERRLNWIRDGVR